MSKVLITGANRGIGLSLTHQLLNRGDTVFAACRKPQLATELQVLEQKNAGRLTIISLDVTDSQSIRGAIATVNEAAAAIDILINNAGILQRHETPENLDEKEMLDSFQVNTIGPMLVVRETLPLLSKGGPAKIINISSQLGSLDRKQSGGLYSYCSSKAALNMMTRALAFDLKSRNITVATVHPGWVQTDMGGPGASITPEASAKGIIALTDRLTIDDTAKFFTWEGAEHPW